MNLHFHTLNSVEENLHLKWDQFNIFWSLPFRDFLKDWLFSCKRFFLEFPNYTLL